MPSPGTILLVEDDPLLARRCEKILREAGYEVEVCYEGESALTIFDPQLHILLITDLKLPGMGGIELLKKVKEKSPETPVLLMTAYAEPEVALSSTRMGAVDFLEKPFTREQLLSAVFRSFSPEPKRKAEEIVPLPPPFASIIGESPSLKRVLQKAVQVAESSASVFLMGESGTGKELLARAIHLTSPYREGPFVVVDCTAIPETLLETELFGYEQGAFTDARKTKPGLLEVASGGTVFLDEIGDLPLSLQGKLLRVLEGKALRRVGGVKEIPVDFRLISATHTDLEKKVKEGRFREDLWYRICVAQISLPPLRERKEDIPLLVEHFLKTFQEKNHSAPKGITEAAIFLLKRYSWPGNIRELRNAIEYAVVVSRSSFIVPEDLPPHILRSLSSDEKSEFFSFPEEILNLPYDSARDKILGEFERRYFQNLLKKTGGNVSSAARIAQLHRSVLYRHFKRWNLPFREEENLEKE